MNLKAFLFIVLSLASTSVLADQNVPVNIPGGGAADLLNVTQFPPSLDGSHDDSGVRFTCTDNYGRMYQKGNPAYDSCLKQKRDQDAKSAVTNTSTTSTNSK
jgi:hypothetical protein